MKAKNAFTLVELIIVIIIIGILATFAVTHYGSVKQKVHDKEAIANLKMLLLAQKYYYEDNSAYYGGGLGITDIAQINHNLGVSLTGNTYWNYEVYGIGFFYSCTHGCVEAWNVDSTACLFDPFGLEIKKAYAQHPPATKSGRGWYLTINDTDGEPNPFDGTHDCGNCE